MSSSFLPTRSGHQTLGVQAYFQMAITCDVLVRFFSFFDMLCKILFRMSAKNKWALPSGAKQQIGPKWRSRPPGGSAHLFFALIRKSILHNISTNDKNLTKTSQVMAILRFFWSRIYSHRNNYEINIKAPAWPRS